MIRDYKFDPTIGARKRRKARSRRLVAVAATVLLGTLAIIQVVDLTEDHPENAQTALRELPVTLLNLQKNDEAASRGSAPTFQDPVVRTQILAIPTKPAEAASNPAKGTAATTPPLSGSESIYPSTQTPVALIHAPAEPAFVAESQPNFVFEPDISIIPAATEPPALDTELTQIEHRWVEHEIKKGDTLAAIFKSFELSPALLHKIVNSGELAANLSRIRPQQKLLVKLGNENELVELVLERDRLTSLHIKPLDDSFAAKEMRKDVERRIATAAGTIESSLFVDGQKAGLNDGLIMGLAEVFGWDVDFALEIRAGDRFNVIYEELYLNGEKFDTGNILAAEFVNRGTPYRAVRYKSSEGDAAYYDADGRNKKRAFIRTPVKFGRISSRFTNRRWHPILKRWRSHKGVDYAAPTGTPIRATGAGRITFQGRKKGYGRVVIIEHAGKYTTVYGHMSKFAGKVKTGSRVKQGQLIGYVGKSGLATGPHLHYEFRVAGSHRNPLRVQLPKSLPLPKKQLPDFREKAQPMLAQLDAMSDDTLVAAATEN